MAEQLWSLGLRPDRPETPLGVENDISETALRAASKLSDMELQLRSLGGNEEEQLRQLRARHQQNLESLGMLQKSMLLPSETFREDCPSGHSGPSAAPTPSGSLQDLVAASAATFPPAAEIAGLSAGPLPGPPGPLGPPPRLSFPSATAMAAMPAASSVLSQEMEAAETAGPLPPPTLLGEAYAATEGRVDPKMDDEKFALQL